MGSDLGASGSRLFRTFVCNIFVPRWANSHHHFGAILALISNAVGAIPGYLRASLGDTCKYTGSEHKTRDEESERETENKTEKTAS